MTRSEQARERMRATMLDSSPEDTKQRLATEKFRREQGRLLKTGRSASQHGDRKPERLDEAERNALIARGVARDLRKQGWNVSIPPPPSRAAAARKRMISGMGAG